MRKLFILSVVLGLTACDNDADLKQCVAYIEENTQLMFNDDGTYGIGIIREVNEHTADGLRASVRFYKKAFPVSMQDAKSISNNWDSYDMKLYSVADGISEHEKDACDVQARLKKYIIENGLNEIWHFNADGTPYEGS